MIVEVPAPGRRGDRPDAVADAWNLLLLVRRRPFDRQAHEKLGTRNVTGPRGA
ncbi:hypothetical protein [Nonomuraea longispora]|uniref:hypothetical protein n=1 Tax=Nonomuraea longispora TaxID=1848320 RepID=UPI0014055032|nr:hypothetical protein [Nonomuraea longispora]